MKKAESFVAPTLAGSDADYAAMEVRLSELGTQSADIARQIGDLENDIRTRPTPRIRAGVASLLAEVIDQDLHARPAKLRDLRTLADDTETAIEIVRRRLNDRRGPASLAACNAARAEYGKRVAAVVQALEAVQVARAATDSLLDDLEAEGIQSGYLPVVQPIFLGDVRDGHVPRFIREVKEAGYV